MESETQFDLEGAVRQWSEALAAQPGMTPETRGELETHLRETWAELRELGLNAEEAFWLACRRTGGPRQLGEEFAKLNPPSRWRMGVLRVAAALLAMRLAEGVVAGGVGGLAWCQLHFGKDPLRLWWADGLQTGLSNSELGDIAGALVVLAVAALIAKCQPTVAVRWWRAVFSSKARFAVMGTLAVAAVFAVEHWSAAIVQNAALAAWQEMGLRATDPPEALRGWRDFHLEPQFSAVLAIIITWLIPSRARAARARLQWFSRRKRA